MFPQRSMFPSEKRPGGLPSDSQVILGVGILVVRIHPGGSESGQFLENIILPLHQAGEIGNSD